MIQFEPWTFLNGFLGGCLSYVVFQGILSLKCYRMQSHINALQSHVLTLRTQSYVNKRWDKRDAFEKEILDLPKSQPAPRYDNDPFIQDIPRGR